MIDSCLAKCDRFGCARLVQNKHSECRSTCMGNKGSALAELKPPDPFEFGTESGWIFSEFCRLLSDFIMSFFRELDFCTYFLLYRTLRHFLTVTLWQTINLKCSLTLMVWSARICHKSRRREVSRAAISDLHPNVHCSNQQSKREKAWVSRRPWPP